MIIIIIFNAIKHIKKLQFFKLMSFRIILLNQIDYWIFLSFRNIEKYSSFFLNLRIIKDWGGFNSCVVSRDQCSSSQPLVWDEILFKNSQQINQKSIQKQTKSTHFCFIHIYIYEVIDSAQFCKKKLFSNSQLSLIH